MEHGLLKIAIGLFILAACFGLVVLLKILTDKPTPKLVVFSHGLIAATALLLVLYTAWNNPQGLLLASLVIFVLAALGGFTLLSFDLRHKPIPKLLAVAHPFVAVIGLLILIVFVVTT